jgi:cell division septal protein FtsQ
MPDEEEHRRPTTNQPLNAAKPRPRWTPLLAVVALVLVIAAVFALITWTRYHT